MEEGKERGRFNSSILNWKGHPHKNVQYIVKEILLILRK